MPFAGAGAIVLAASMLAWAAPGGSPSPAAGPAPVLAPVALAVEDAAEDAAEARGPEAAVRDFLRRRYEGEWSRFDLLEVRWTNGAPPAGASVGLLVGDAAPTVNGSLLLQAEIEGGEGGVLRLPLSVRVRPWCRVPVAVRAIGRGALLRPEDVRIEERTLAELRGARPAPADRLDGIRARRGIAAGEILTAQSVEEVPAVSPGDRVTIRFVSGPIRLEAAGIARRPGRIGQTIVVENIDSRRTILGTVVGERLVEVGSQ